MNITPGHNHTLKGRIRYVRARFKYWRKLFFALFEKRLKLISSLLGGLVGVASVVSVVLLVVYIGYNLSSSDEKLIKHILRGIQIVYGVHILFHLIFFFRVTIRESHIIKWIVDIGIILSLIFWMFPGIEKPWLPTLNHILFGNISFFIAVGAYSTVDICYSLSRIPGRRTNPTLLMASSFIVFIIMGSFLLMLPRCTYHGISYTDSLFISSSAVSITGLSSVDIPSTFTPLGILVLSLLIQLGSLGIITFTSFFAMFFTGNTSIYNQLLLKDIVYSKSMNSLIPTLLYVLGFTLTIEIIGGVCVFFTIPDSLGLELKEKIIFAGFHSMSSFCNVGFSCIPDGMSNLSLLHSNQSIYIVTSLLIFAGAVGFPILVNFKEILKFNIKKSINSVLGTRKHMVPVHMYDLNTKIVLCTTLSVLAVGIVSFFLLEYNNTLRGMSLYEKIVQSLFNSLVPRSAGFASVNPASFLDITLLLILAQMFIGGSSQSMAGGIKVNTFGTAILNLKSVLLGHHRATAFHRTINQASVRRANAVIVISGLTLGIYVMTVLYLEPQLPSKSLIFEVVSALFTVGSSLGITAELGNASKVLLCTAMFLGRVGILSLIAGITTGRRDVSDHYPEDSVIIN